MDTQGHVLIVDDNELNREILARRLERFGYTYSMAEDGLEAMQKLRANDGVAYDLVLLDIMMPVMNGFEVLEQTRIDPTLKNIPVVVISAVNELESVVKCIELGAEDYLFKPFNTVLLRARLAAIIDRKRIRAASGDTPLVRHTITELQTQITRLLDARTGILNAEQLHIVQVIQRCIMTLTASTPRLIMEDEADPSAP